MQTSQAETGAPSDQLDKEEISELLDMVLCADDLVPDARVWHSEICGFFQRGSSQEKKADALKLIYGELDEDYTIRDGGHQVHVLGQDGGIVFQADGGDYFYSYLELSKRIDAMILDGTYPFSAEEEKLDDFAIPDEKEELEESPRESGTGDAVERQDDFHGQEQPDSGTYVNPDTPEPPSKQEVIDYFLTESGSGYEGGKQRIYRAMTSILSIKERVKELKHEYGVGGKSANLENGGSYDIDFNSKGFRIEYIHDGADVRELLTWEKVEERIRELISQDAYLSAEEKAELERLEEMHYTLEDAGIPEEVLDRQISLFDLGMESGYEDNTGSGQDALLDADKVREPSHPFPEGEQILYNGRVYEILQYLYDGRTDISQPQDKDGSKARERVPVTEIKGCQPIKDSRIDGGTLSLTEGAVQSSGPAAGEAEALQAAVADVEAMQEDEPYGHTIPDGTDRSGSYGLNYRYSEEHHLYDGGPKAKFQNNVEAIRLLKELERQGRRATAQEQVTLAKFVGWGGLANALTPGKSGWEAQHEEIKGLLTEEEFQTAQESTLTAYYTEQGVVRHIYDALEKFGFHGGNILDPAMATGNFFSVLPESMAGSRLYGVEIEPISGHIARHLYPSADIQVTGFEHTSHPDQFFDVVIGNIPFNSIKVDDPRYNRYNFRIHDYFLAKSLDKTRPGGIVAVITSKYTLDKANSNNRRYLAQRAELLGAIRLPNSAFKQVAGTEATTDILFLKKREREVVPDEANSSWLSVEQNKDGIPMNTWFIGHPEMVLGRMVFDESMYGSEKTTACHPIPGDDLDERLERAVSYLEGTYEELEQEGDVPQAEGAPEIRAIPAEMAVELGKNVYSLEYIDKNMYPDIFKIAKEKGIKIRHPMIGHEKYGNSQLYRDMYGHMGEDTPIVGVFGTGIAQGKFTTQLMLRRILKKRGLKVNNFGTETHCELFGFEGFCPLEMNLSIRFPREQIIKYIQGEIRRLEIENKPDIILVGGQSGVVPYSYAIREDEYTIPTLSFLMATVPHAYILCINATDTVSFIRETVQVLESLGKGKVIALVVSRRYKTIAEDTRVACLRILDGEAFQNLREKMRAEFQLPLFDVMELRDAKTLGDCVCQYFTG